MCTKFYSSLQDLKVLEERIEGLKLSEQRANSALSDAKARMHEQKEQYNVCSTAPAGFKYIAEH